MGKLNELIKIGKYWMFDLKAAQQAIDRYSRSDSKINRVHLINSIFRARARHQFSFDEFFFYGLDKLPDCEKENFISFKEHYMYLNKINAIKTTDIFKYKDQTYQHYARFYQRDLVRINGIEDAEVFCNFVKAGG